MPTVNQMRARMLQGHRLALAAVRDGKALNIGSDGEWRGYRTVFATLRRWGALDDDNQLTDVGRALLETVTPVTPRNGEAG